MLLRLKRRDRITKEKRRHGLESVSASLISPPSFCLVLAGWTSMVLHRVPTETLTRIPAHHVIIYLSHSTSSPHSHKRNFIAGLFLPLYDICFQFLTRRPYYRRKVTRQLTRINWFVHPATTILPYYPFSIVDPADIFLDLSQPKWVPSSMSKSSRSGSNPM
jgi:hypothetical protein